MVAVEEYIEGIKTLILLAQGDTGGSRVAAQVLLSAYNGEAFQLNVVDLGNLDQKHYQAALSVIQGRVELHKEPQNMIENGSSVFKNLWRQWQAYHVCNRAGKKE